MLALFRITRFPNLVVITVTQWLVAVSIIGSSAVENGINTALNHQELILLMLATLSISAAAYCINDVLDYQIDIINHPKKVIVNKLISISTVYWLIMVFTIFGFICALILALEKGELKFLWLYPFFTLLLGGYSRIFKVRPFVGNLLIASSCAGVAGLIWLAERSTWSALPEDIKTNITYLLIIFMLYAFLATWIREIVKDLEDYHGDRVGGRKTLPITYSIFTAKIIIHFLAILLGTALAIYTFVWESSDFSSPVFVLTILLLILLFYMQGLLIYAKQQDEYHRLSRFWKYFMLGGLVLLFLY